MDETTYGKQWKDAIEHIKQNQEGAAGYPGAWLLEKMSQELCIYPLRFGDEDFGYLLWMKPQDQRIRKGMKALKAASMAFDEEVELRMIAQRRVAELEARFAAAHASDPFPRVTKAAKPKAFHDEKESGESKGKTAYEGKLAGQPWSELGGKSGQLCARHYAEANGLAWPILGAGAPAGQAADTPER